MRWISLLMVLLMTGLVGCDHATKWLAQSELRGQEPKVLIAGTFDLRYVENRDVGFSLLQGVPEHARTPLILGIGAVGIALLAGMWWRRRGAGGLELAGYALVLAGAIGNVSDRLVRGYVVDFLHVYHKSFHWPVFNVADICLVVGVGLLLLFSRPQPALSPK